MTKKDYIVLATAIRSEVDKQSGNPYKVMVLSDIIEALCEALEDDNSRFDPIKFKTFIFKEAN